MILLQIAEQFDIVSHLFTVSPVLGVLVWVVMYFRKRLAEKEDELKELHTERRDLIKDYVTIMTAVENTLEKLAEKIDRL
jgi:uncharacterized membrane protein YciS (DUF1049 family)